MEKDIKILEWSQQQMRLGNLPDYNQKVYKAIENVLNRNKELEETLKDNWEFRDKYYIPKSKVEEKIEELKEKGESDLRTYGFAIETHLAKQVLEELLQEGEDNANI